MASQRRGRRRLPPVQTGLLGRCRECGEGHLFKSLLGFHDCCAACGANFTSVSLWLFRLMQGAMFNITWQRHVREVRLQDFKGGGASQ